MATTSPPKPAPLGNYRNPYEFLRAADEEQARALADAYSQAQAQLAFNRAELAAKLRALLTAEQRQQIDSPHPAHPGPRPTKP